MRLVDLNIYKIVFFINESLALSVGKIDTCVCAVRGKTISSCIQYTYHNRTVFVVNIIRFKLRA